MYETFDTYTVTVEGSSPRNFDSYPEAMTHWVALKRMGYAAEIVGG